MVVVSIRAVATSFLGRGRYSTWHRDPGLRKLRPGGAHITPTVSGAKPGNTAAGDAPNRDRTTSDSTLR